MRPVARLFGHFARQSALLAAFALALSAPLSAADARADVAADKPITAKVIGGHTAPEGRFPYIVSIRDSGPLDNFRSHFCGGTIISRRAVVTAAHCVENLEPGDIEIVVGTNDLDKGGKTIKVKGITIHPGYDPRSQDNDIAVVFLKRAVAQRRVASLLSKAEESVLARPGRKATVAGWGVSSVKGDEVPNLLQVARVPVVDQDTCRASYGRAVTDNMICGGYPQGKVDTCYGDSGGPMIVPDLKGRPRLAGITSWGIGCAQPRFYGVYTRAANFKSWVAKTVAAGPQTKPVDPPVYICPGPIRPPFKPPIAMP